MKIEQVLRILLPFKLFLLAGWDLGHCGWLILYPHCCGQPEDWDYDGMVESDRCKKWYHQKCVGYENSADVK